MSRKMYHVDQLKNDIATRDIRSFRKREEFLEYDGERERAR